MNKKRLTSILITTLLFGFLFLFVTPLNANAFRFVAWADTKSAVTSLGQLSNQIRALSTQPVFTIYPGDLESDGVTSSGMARWKDAVNGYSNNGIFDITFPVRGNHDNRNGASPWSAYFNLKGQAAGISGISNFRELAPDLTYSFDYGNSHFVGIDGPGSVSQVKSTHTDWLRTDLRDATNRGLTHAFIYFHGPISWIANHSSTTPSHLVSVLNDFPIITATFHGHEHAYAWVHLDSSRVSGLNREIEQFVTGSAGAGPTTCYSNKCDYDLKANGFATVDVNGNDITVSFYKRGSSSPAWTKTFTKGGPPRPTFTPGPSKTPTPTRKPSTTPTQGPSPTPGQQEAFPNGVPHAIPGKIEAENFDSGGPGTAYHDFENANLGNSSYRSGEQVDISGTSDTGGGQHVGWTEANEWLEYTVNIQTSGTYTFQARIVNNASGGKFRMEIDGSNKTGSITVPNTNTWTNWQTIEKNVTLSQGQHVMRIYYETVASGGSYHVGDYNWFNFIRLTTGTPGDGNNDGLVNGKDFIIWLSHFGQNVGGANNGDYNGNGQVRISDYIIWINNFTGF